VVLDGIRKFLLAAGCAVLAMLQFSSALAEEAGYIDNRQCIGCHKPYKQAFQNSTHGRAFASNAASGCQSCHGGGAAHKEVAGEENYTGPLKIESFKKTSGTAEDRSRPCLTCHENRTHANWRGSPHDMGEVACTDCHNLHKADGKVRQDACFTCHKEQRAQSNRPSHHPILEGKVSCPDCHNPHGSSGPKLLHKNTVNETCYTCHAEKRGPFLWEHAPVSDDCVNCHTPHGSNNTALLKNRLPYLCSSCHIANGHSTTGIRNGTDLGVVGGGTSAAPQMTGKSCLNCHSQIHGSNHPSGARFAR
jgi:DmsE family decaheme c-type cytochrome